MTIFWLLSAEPDVCHIGLDDLHFEAVGRQSLVLALVFIGGITLSLLFTYQEAIISSPEFWVTNILFVLFTVLIFFLSMRPTHSLLAAERKRELQPIQARINKTCRDLVLRLNQLSGFRSAVLGDQCPGCL